MATNDNNDKGFHGEIGKNTAVEDDKIGVTTDEEMANLFRGFWKQFSVGETDFVKFGGNGKKRSNRRGKIVSRCGKK